MDECLETSCTRVSIYRNSVFCAFLFWTCVRADKARLCVCVDISIDKWRNNFAMAEKAIESLRGAQSALHTRHGL